MYKIQFEDEKIYTTQYSVIARRYIDKQTKSKRKIKKITYQDQDITHNFNEFVENLRKKLSLLRPY